MLNQASSACFASLVASASVEISSRGHQLQELRDNFAPGTDVTITFLPGDNYSHNVETAAALRRAGFNPVPHIAAREIASRKMLDDFLSRLRGEADATRVLLIAGDVAAARGPFKSSGDVRASRLLQAHHITRVSVAGHPEGHPYLDEAARWACLRRGGTGDGRLARTSISSRNSVSRVRRSLRCLEGSRRAASIFLSLSVLRGPQRRRR